MGVWYVHVRFKNNIGWGPSAHYKISIDRTAPAVFEIRIDNAVTENPAPVIRYETSDALSGLGEVGILVDDNDLIRVGATTTSFALPLQPPGKHMIVVRAVDKAGNALEDDQDLEILPLAKPSFDFVPKSVSQGEVIFVSGKSVAGGFVDIVLKNSDGIIKAKIIADVDSSGGWKASIEEFVPLGMYSITAVGRDNRGALSYPTDSFQVKVRPKVIISIGSLDLGAFDLIILGLSMVVLGAAVVYWNFLRTRNRRDVYKTIAMRDVEKFAEMLENDVEALQSLHGDGVGAHDEKTHTDINARIGRMKEKIAKMRKYLPQEVKKMD